MLVNRITKQTPPPTYSATLGEEIIVLFSLGFRVFNGVFAMATQEANPTNDQPTEKPLVAGNAGSRPIPETSRTSNLTVEDIRALSQSETVRLACLHRAHFTAIHDSIIAQWELQGFLSPQQLNTLKSFILVFSKRMPEEEAQQAGQRKIG